MVNVKVTRENRMEGALNKYYCVFNLAKEEIEEHIGDKIFLGPWNKFIKKSPQIIPIANGETISVDIINGQKNTLFVIMFNIATHTYGNEITFDNSSLNLSYVVKTMSDGGSFKPLLFCEKCSIARLKEQDN